MDFVHLRNDSKNYLGTPQNGSRNVIDTLYICIVPNVVLFELISSQFEASHSYPVAIRVVHCMSSGPAQGTTVSAVAGHWCRCQLPHHTGVPK